MSLSSTGPATGRRPRRSLARAAVALAVAAAVLAPLAVLCAQMWTHTGRALAFTRDERRGVAYLGPLTELLSAATAAQSAAVRGAPVDRAPSRAALAAVDGVDARLGAALRTSDRWADARRTVLDRLSRGGWPQPSEAYNQYSDLNTALLELTRTVGDNSRLVLDPAIDTYYVMSASLLQIPAILVDSGRYADLSIMATGSPDPTLRSQLAAGRNRIATDAADLSDGLLKAFGRTGSETLAPGLTQRLDDFRTAVDAVAPSASLLAPAPERSPPDLVADQEALARAGLDLQRAALGQLDRLLATREAGQQRSRLIAAAATAVGVLVAAGLATLWWRAAPVGPPRSTAVPSPAEPAARDRLGVPVPEPAGGARAAR